LSSFQSRKSRRPNIKILWPALPHFWNGFLCGERSRLKRARTSRPCSTQHFTSLFAYKAKKENNQTLFSSKRIFWTFFSKRNVHILVAMPLENLRRVKTCAAIQKRKSGKRTKTRTRTKTKKSGKIWERKKVRKERRKKNNQAK